MNFLISFSTSEKKPVLIFSGDHITSADTYRFQTARTRSWGEEQLRQDCTPGFWGSSPLIPVDSGPFGCRFELSALLPQVIQTRGMGAAAPVPPILAPWRRFQSTPGAPGSSQCEDMGAPRAAGQQASCARGCSCWGAPAPPARPSPGRNVQLWGPVPEDRTTPGSQPPRASPQLWLLSLTRQGVALMWACACVCPH